MEAKFNSQYVKAELEILAVWIWNLCFIHHKKFKKQFMFTTYGD